MNTFLACFILLTVGPVAQAQDLNDYPIQAFRSLHPNFWYGTSSGDVLDAERYVVGEIIALKSRSVAKGSYGLALIRPDSYRVEATINVHSARARACHDGAITSVSAYLTLAAFNTNGWGTPGNATGDVRAILAAQRRSTQSGEDQTVRLAYLVVICSDAACTLSERNVVQSGDLGVMPFDAPTKVMVGWDHATNRFFFQVSSNSWVYTTPYALREGFRPGVPQESITIEHDVGETCGEAGSSRMDLSVSNVKLAVSRVMTDKLSYNSGEPVYVSYTGMPAWDTSALIGIDRQDVLGHSQYKYLTYSGENISTGAGSATFIEPLSSGTYTARYFDGAGKMIAESRPFFVGAGR